MNDKALTQPATAQYSRALAQELLKRGRRLVRHTVLGLIGGVLCMDLAEATPAESWCRVDDPATWQANDGRSCPAIADPQSLPDELVLPLPCGRKSVLRKVVVPATTVLDHSTIWIGSMSDEGAAAALNQVVNGPRQTALAGGFSVDANGRPVVRGTQVAWNAIAGRAYYIAKYELPEHHWQLLGAGLFDTATEHDKSACEAYDQTVSQLNERRIRPASNLSWFDAMSFTRAWSAWLVALDRARVPAKPPYLPWEQGTPSYIRLPTEVEWEFAARGGLARQEDTLLRGHLIKAETGSRPGALEEVAVIAEISGSRRSPIETIGSKQPNLLGLHDVIGNVDEIVFDLFQLVRPDAPHGQYGGYLVKGGNAFISRNALSVSHRREVPFFDLRGERRSETTGFRPMLALPVFVSAIGKSNRWEAGLQNPEWMEAVQVARNRIAQSSDQDREDAARRLEKLQAESSAGKLQVVTLQASLSEIQRSLERSNTQLNERDKEILRERVQTTTLVGSNINSLGRNIFGTRLQLDRFLSDYTTEQLKPYQAQLDSLKRSLQADEKNLDSAFAYYVSNVLTLARENPKTFNGAMADMRERLRRQQLKSYDRYIELTEKHVTAARASKGNVSQVISEQWLTSLDETRKRREERFGR